MKCNQVPGSERLIFKKKTVKVYLKSVPPCGKLLLVVDPEDPLVLVNPLSTGDCLVPGKTGLCCFLIKAEDMSKKSHKFKIIRLTNRFFWFTILLIRFYIEGFLGLDDRMMILGLLSMSSPKMALISQPCPLASPAQWALVLQTVDMLVLYMCHCFSFLCKL